MVGLRALARTIVMLLSVVSASVIAHAQQERIVHSFDGTDGSSPTAALLVDKAGNFYGTTFWGGGCGLGTVFELAPAAGEWTLTTLHSLCPTYVSANTAVVGFGEGQNPAGSLTFDSQGNLYGTTTAGVIYYYNEGERNKELQGVKAFPCCESFQYNGPGTAFQLLKPTSTDAPWTINPIFDFDAGATAGNLLLDSAGNVYGVNGDGSSQAYHTCNPCGSVFELSPQPVGQFWTISYPHSFGSYLGDGLMPAWNLLSRNGIFYGTTLVGGTSSQGTVFQLRKVNGTWVQTVIHNFQISEGGAPQGELIADPAGNLYGTTYIDGKASCTLGCGTIFELSPPTTSDGTWKETTLYTFTGGTDGDQPQAGLVRDTAGNLYGTTANGGSGDGAVFELVAPSAVGATWKKVTLHQFTGKPTDGSAPLGQLLLIGTKLFGTTSSGGKNGDGTVFTLTLPSN